MSKRFQCETCGHAFHKAAHLKAHQVVHTKERAFKCTFRNCNKTFLRADHLKRHLKIHARATGAASDSNFNRHPCPHCPQSFAYAHGLKRHIRNVHNKQHKCGECPLTFKSPELLKQHEFVHTGIPPFNCSTCNQSFKVFSKYQAHIKTAHISIACIKCGSEFLSKEAYQAHPCIVKNAVKPTVRSPSHVPGKHECPIDGCTKSYAYARNLEAHINASHLNEKPHQCTYCDKSFAYKHVLQRHIEKVHEAPVEESEELKLVLGRVDNENVVDVTGKVYVI